jgi:hypothetical protein
MACLKDMVEALGEAMQQGTWISAGCLSKLIDSMGRAYEASKQFTHDSCLGI